MTSHNLRQHLTWLLSTKPFIPPPSAHQAATRSFESFPSSATLPNDTATVPAAGRPRDHETRPRENQLQQETLDAPPEGGEQSADDMAKLKIAPSSASKPRMMMLDSPETKHTSRGSVQRQPVARTGRESSHAVVSDFRKRENVAIDIHKSPPSPTGYYHTVDLTEERPDKWQQSKKRKSEEFAFDTPSRRHKPKKVKEDDHMKAKPAEADFASIDDYDQPSDPPPPYSTIARPRPALKANENAFDASLDDFDASLFDTNDGEEYITEAQFRIRTRMRKSISRRPSDSQDAVKAKSPRRSPLKMNKEPDKTQRRPKAPVIEDSEDDFDAEMSDQEPYTSFPARQRSPSPRKLSSVLPPVPSLQDRRSPTESPKREAALSRARSQSPTKAQMLQEVESALLLRKNGHGSNGIDNRTVSDPTKTPIFDSQSSAVGDLSAEDKAKVEVFLRWPDSELQGLVLVARTKVDQMEEEALEQEFTGISAPNLVSQTEEAKARLHKLESLQRLTRVHKRHVERKDKIFKDLCTLFSEGRMPDNDMTTENKEITTRISKTEANIHMWLRELAVIDENGQILEISEPSKPTRVMVHSTQVSPFNGVPQESSQVESSGVRQTQYAGNVQTNAEKATYTRNRNVAESQQPSFSAREAPFPQMPRKMPAQKIPSIVRNEYSNDDGFGDDVNLFQDQVFTHNMGGVVHAISDDEEENYGDSDEEGIFAEIPDTGAENVTPNRSMPPKNPFLKPPLPLGKPNRVLSESSGNPTRYPPASQHSTQARSQVKQSSPKQRHKWTNEVHRVLKHTFKMKGFRPHQEEAINETLAGKDVFVLMPTGGGKSLCYQLPALVMTGKSRGVTIVVSPLLSLMEDQVTYLQERLNVAAFFINGESTREHRNFITTALKDPNVEGLISMLYVTPELLSNSPGTVRALNDLYNNGLFARLVIDEAHCVSQWGHDFRPDYKALGEVRKQFAGVPLMALTATATENVKVDVRHNLGMGNCKTLTQSFNRPGLEYEVRPKKPREIMEDIADFIKTKYRGKCGIIYCLSRKKCEDVAKKLMEKHQIRAAHFHAGMTPADKSQTQKDWQAGKIHIVVATIAFGMGIDKPDVRFVIHHSIPKSLEGYYQETGRAGRDGKKSQCVLFYGYQDATILKKMIDDGEGDRQQKDRQNAMLRKVVQFCENQSDCRRAQVLLYFNEPFTPAQCNKTCDNCRSTSRFEPMDFTEHAAGAVKVVEQVTKRATEKSGFTLLHCVDIYRGAKNSAIKANGHSDIVGFGDGSEIVREDLERLFYHLIKENALQEYSVVNGKGFAQSYIGIGPRFRAFSQGQVPVELQVRVTPRVSKVVDKLAAKKIKKKKAPVKSTTGVKAARAMPISTNVSSPIQPRRKAASKHPVLDNEDDDENDFIVPDHEPIPEESDDNDFEESARPAVSRRRPASPVHRLSEPITIDAKMAELSDIHADIVEQFVAEGKKECMTIRNQFQLRSQPFSDTALREMAINWPQDLNAMEQIPNISKLSIEAYGTRIMRILNKYKTFYDDATRQGEDVVDDPNKRIVNVIDLCSDEEYGSEIDLTADEDNNDDDDDEDSGPLQTSGYFSSNSRPARLAEDQKAQQEREDAIAFEEFRRERAQQQASYSQQGPSKQRSSSGSRGPWKKNFKGGRKGSGGGSFKKGKSAAGVSKRAPATAKRNSGAGTSSNRRPAGGGAGGIGMMPV